SGLYPGMRRTLRPVAALGGEERNALYFDNTATYQQFYNTLGGAETTTDTVSLRGLTSIGKWDVDYRVGMARGTALAGTTNNFSLVLEDNGTSTTTLDPAFLSSAAVDPVE